MDSEKIRRELKDEIAFLDLAPESILNISELAEKFGVSRTPVKEALIALQTENWVVRHGAHFMVSPLTLESIREITEIRTLLEVQANVWSMQRMAPEVWNKLIRLRDEIKSKDSVLNCREVVELDFKFHRTLYQATQNSNLALLLERMLGHYMRFWLSISRTMERDAFFRQTMKIINAIELNDEKKVREASFNHIRDSVNNIVRLI